MPNHEEHCQESLRRYGKSFSELHRWMDEPSTIMGSKHRMHRHDPYTTPKVAKALFGEYADQACLDHIRLDHQESARKGVKTVHVSLTKQNRYQDSARFGFGALLSLVFGALLISQSYSVWAGVILLFISFLAFLAFLGSLIEKNEERTQNEDKENL